jgi:hypothetical protein
MPTPDPATLVLFCIPYLLFGVVIGVAYPVIRSLLARIRR